MTKLRNMLIAAIAIASLSTSAMAGAGFGVTGSIAAIGASGTEADKNGAADTSVRKAEASNNAAVASVFAEYTFDNGFTLGVDWMPGSADVNSSSITRADTTPTEAPANTKDNITRKAAAEVDNHLTYYAEVPLGGSGLYGKLGMVTLDVNSNETSATAGGYGNDSTDGVLYGLGYKSELGSNSFYKVEGTHTEFDTITLNGKSADKGNKITADVDVTKITFALGYAF